MIRDFADLDLDQRLIQSIEEMGYSHPTQIQAASIPVALEGKDVLASAPTGTGKTAAFAIPAIQYLLDFPRKKPGPARILILTPTRELAIQIAEQVRLLAKYTQLNIFTITGGVQYQEHASLLRSTQDIVVATPGRLTEYIESETFDCRAIEWLILDEADRMLDMGFGPVVERLSDECRWRKQSLLFSATLEGHGVETFSSRLLDNPQTVQSTPPRRERKKITQWYYRADDLSHKVELLKHILSEQSEKAIVFIKTRERLAELRGALEQASIQCSWIQGEMPQDRRNNAISRFRDGQVNILLATDVAARGIDIADITHVINYDLPRSADVFVHRIGRTARAGKKGIAISLVEAHDQPMMERVMRYTKEDIKERFVDGLRPQHKKPTFKKKKKKAKTASKTTGKNTSGKRKKS